MPEVALLGRDRAGAIRPESTLPVAFSACARFLAKDHVLGLSSAGLPCLPVALQALDEVACGVGMAGANARVASPSADVTTRPDISDVKVVSTMFSIVNADPKP
jgi:hypothetical protein